MSLSQILERKPFVIAEVGSNWGSLQDCLTSISLAKACGADAVKFQAYSYEALFGVERKLTHEPKNWDVSDEVKAMSWKAHGMVGELPLDWLPMLKEKADVVGIECMCSAFSVPLLDAVDEFVSIHKLASSEMTHVRMLQRLKEIGKPVILSTGAQTTADIQMALKVLFPTPVILLYCPAAYPAKWTDLDRIPKMALTFGVPIGFSDHTLDVLSAPKQAIKAGAVVIEKHVNFVGAQSPDSPHSLDMDEFKVMVQAVRGRHAPLIGPTPEELPFILRHKRRIIATQDISVGQLLSEGENFGLFRSTIDDTRAASPWLIDQVGGKSAKIPIKAGQGIWLDDVH